MRRSSIILLAWMLTFFFLGIAEPFFPLRSGFKGEMFAIQAFISAFFVFGWCRTHADERGIIAPRGSAVWAMIAAPIGVPLYFFRSMPWRAASMATLKALGFWLALAISGAAGILLGCAWSGACV